MDSTQARRIDGAPAAAPAPSGIPGYEQRWRESGFQRTAEFYMVEEIMAWRERFGALPGELTDAAIDEVWSGMPGGADGWLKQFGYRQFARAVARHVLVRVAASMAGIIRPTDDELWEQTIGQRDHNHDMADKLAEAIAQHFGAEIGEHSNMNCPWVEALDVIDGAPAPQAQTDARDQALEEVEKAIGQILWEIENGDGLKDEVYGAERCRDAIRALKAASKGGGAS